MNNLVLKATVFFFTVWAADRSFAQTVQPDSARVAQAAKRSADEAYRLRNDWAWIQRFDEANKKIGEPKPGEDRVVFMGNSITSGWIDMMPGFFRDKPWINRGIGGQTTPQMLVRFRQDVINLKPKVVLILAGTNDIAGNTGPTALETIIGNIESMAQLAQVSGIRVVISSILPVFDYPWKKGLEPVAKIAFINEELKKFAEANRMVYLDYYSAMIDDRKGLKADLTYDGVHPNKAGYQVMQPLAEAAIAKALKLKR